MDDHATPRAEGSSRHTIVFAAPGARHYETVYYRNHRGSWANVSVTGNDCARRCVHCEGRALERMIEARTPEDMVRLVDTLALTGCRGILVSGGADARGRVPLGAFLPALARARERGLRVVAHTGLLDVAEARRLKAAGVEQVLLEVVGDRGTIAEVLRADARPEDYLDAMLACREAGLAFAPHVVIGLHYGSVLGEPAALRMASEAGADALVLVILEPLSGTPMEAVEPPGLGPTAELFAAARELLPSVPLALGCARPHGEDMLRVEELALTSGVDAIAYPHAVTIARAQALDMTIEFSELCCSLAVGGHTPADDSSGSGASTVPGPS